MLQFFGLNDTSRTVKTIAKMAAGNLRTAANNDQDDDPRALVPIPIATREMTSLVERLNPGVNAEVVRFVFLSRANCFVFFPNVSLMIARRITRPRAAQFCASRSPAKKGERKRAGRVFPGFGDRRGVKSFAERVKFGRAFEFIFSRRPIIFFGLNSNRIFLFPRDEKEHARTRVGRKRRRPEN